MSGRVDLDPGPASAPAWAAPDSLAALRATLGSAFAHELLDPEAERRLVIAAQGGDAAATDQLVRTNVRLVASQIATFPSAVQRDLFQEGMLALLSAIRQFDPARGTRLSTFAVWCIRSRLLRVTAGRRVLSTAGHVTSVNDLDRQGRELLDRLHDRTEASPEDAVLDRHRPAELRRALAELDPLDRRALELYIGEDGEGLRSFVDVGVRIGVSRETARKCVNRALSRLRSLIATPATQ